MKKKNDSQNCIQNDWKLKKKKRERNNLTFSFRYNHRKCTLMIQVDFVFHFFAFILNQERFWHTKVGLLWLVSLKRHQIAVVNSSSQQSKVRNNLEYYSLIEFKIYPAHFIRFLFSSFNSTWASFQKHKSCLRLRFMTDWFSENTP